MFAVLGLDGQNRRSIQGTACRPWSFESDVEYAKGGVHRLAAARIASVTDFFDCSSSSSVPDPSVT